MKRQTFTVRTEWYDAISQLPEQEQLNLYKKLFLFHKGNQKEAPLTTDSQRAIWAIIENKLSPPENRKTWKNDFDTYLLELDRAFTNIISDKVFITEQYQYHPKLDIRLSIEKAYRTYWRTEVAWRKKKRSGTQKINWHTTFANALNQPFNHVYSTGNPTENDMFCEWLITSSGSTRKNTYSQYLLDIKRYGHENVKFIRYVK